MVKVTDKEVVLKFDNNIEFTYGWVGNKVKIISRFSQSQVLDRFIYLPEQAFNKAYRQAVAILNSRRKIEG